jgi:hypothetical protein
MTGMGATTERGNGAASIGAIELVSSGVAAP